MAHAVGQRVRHRFNAELGVGRVVGAEGRMLLVEFPATGQTLRLASDTDALEELQLARGTRVRRLADGALLVLKGSTPEGRLRLSDGSEAAPEEVFPVEDEASLVRRLARGDAESLARFSLRLQALRLEHVRRADGLGSFLGGRIELYPHQLYVAERATATDPVRWLLADEVGLGKTVEACLILNHLVRTARADRTLVLAPDTLTVQWLGELWRKYHQVFVLLDAKRLLDVEREFGVGFNPFDSYSRVVLGFDQLESRPELARQAEQAGLDLLVVDEAHHLRRPPHHPGNALYRLVQPLAAAAPHTLLLSATPLEDDAHGYFRLLQLLRPDVYPEELSFAELLESGQSLPACTSATRRSEIGGLPPREPHPVDLSAEGWRSRARLLQTVSAEDAPHAVAERNKRQRIVKALASGAALAAGLTDADAALKRKAAAADADDPRLEWLVAQSRGWRERGEKTLVFAAERETLEWLRTALRRRAQLQTGVFHEDLAPGQRDIEVAQFRLPKGPSLLVSTECGGEGRNFQFCRRIVLWDLPWDPMVVEQRIGRLDRIGRRGPVEIVYFRPPGGIGLAVVKLYEELGLFRRPLGGLVRELAGVETALGHLALGSGDPAELDTLLRAAREGEQRIQQAAWHELYREPYRPQMGPQILARLPEGLDERVEEVVVGWCEQLGLDVERQRGSSTFSIELGNRALVESLPGVPGGSGFLGTFDRAEGVEKETIDFFASGHPLVEGLLLHLEESPDGRAGLVHITGRSEAEAGFGLAAVYREDTGLSARAVDLDGAERPAWAERLLDEPFRSRRVKAEDWTGQPGWAELIESLGARLLADGREPQALCALRVDPPR